MRFRYLGEPVIEETFSQQGCSSIIVPTTVGRRKYKPLAPETIFVVGADIGYNITDPLEIAALSKDTHRFVQA